MGSSVERRFWPHVGRVTPKVLLDCSLCEMLLLLIHSRRDLDSEDERLWWIRLNILMARFSACCCYHPCRWTR